MNRYRLTRVLTEEIEHKLRKAKLIGNDDSINVKLQFEKHLPDRILDHEIPLDEISYILDGIIRHCGSFLYVFERNESNRINVYGKKNLMFGVTGKKTRNGNYIFKIRTVYYERNAKYRHREIKAESFYIEEYDNAAKLRNYVDLPKFIKFMQRS